MKLAATFSNDVFGTDFGAIRDIVQTFEEVGFDGISCNDHVVGGHPDRAGGEKVHTIETAVHEPFVLLSFIGAVTTRLELATAILLLPQRQTVLAAKQAAEIDLLSGGRLRLGVGVGRNWMEYEALNEDFSNRGKRMEEQIEVMRRLWTEDLVTFDGQWHHLDRIGLNPGSVQKPIPIWMGSFFGSVSERVLERVGRMADGWLPQFPPKALAPILERVHGYARDAGRDPSTLGIECAMRVEPGGDPQTWIDTALAYKALGATHLKVGAMGFATPQEHADATVRWYEAVAPAVR